MFINALTPNDININTSKPGLITIPIGIYIFNSSLLWIIGRCLSISTSVNFTNKLPKAILVVVGQFTISSVGTFIYNCFYFRGSPGIVYFYVVLYHTIILSSTLALAYYTYRMSK